MYGAQNSYFDSYSSHQDRYFGLDYTGAESSINTNSMAKKTNNFVMWGTNALSTMNLYAFAYIRAVEDIKNRYNKSQTVFIGPKFVDTGITLADTWIKSKPYTDPAIIASIVYYLLDNTFDLNTGELKPDPILDVDYLDTMFYGFFDSPEYWVKEADGTIVTTKPGDGELSQYRHIPEVPAGKSYCSWILGNNTKAKAYSNADKNYTAKQFASKNMRRWTPCSFSVKGKPATDSVKTYKYKTKQDYLTHKNAEWSYPITGVSAESIEKLAKINTDGPVLSSWSYGMQKQHDGVINLYAMQALHVITKNVGKEGAAIIWWSMGPI